jgi:hypothetical protein
MFVYQDHQDPEPTPQTVLSSVKYRGNPIDEVYTIEKMYGEWIMFFKMNDSLYVSKLKRKGINQWEVVNWHDDHAYIGRSELDQDGVTLGATLVSNDREEEYVSFYFGMISKPEIDLITLEIEEGETIEIDLYEAEGNRFFFYLYQDGDVQSFSLNAFANGENIKTSR